MFETERIKYHVAYLLNNCTGMLPRVNKNQMRNSRSQLLRIFAEGDPPKLSISAQRSKLIAD